jgi:hypothetical protein
MSSNSAEPLPEWETLATFNTKDFADYDGLRLM